MIFLVVVIILLVVLTNGMEQYISQEIEINITSSVLSDDILLSRKRSINMIPTKEQISMNSKKLCLEAKHFFNTLEISCWQTDDADWHNFISELWIHLLNENDCMNFINYAKNRWNPRIFWWPLSGTQIKSWIQRLFEDELWGEEWINPAIAGNYYAPLMVPLLTFKFTEDADFANNGVHMDNFHLRIGTMQFKHDRISHLHHLYVLNVVTERKILPKNLLQIIEFGGGTGDNIPMFREMGFTGTHIVYDFTPMLLTQQFFLRLSNWPAYYGDNITYETLYARKTLLMPSDKVRRLTQALHPTSTVFKKKTLFLATWSLSESPLITREEVMTEILEYQVGIILIVFKLMHGESTIENIPWAKELATKLVYKHGYEVCIWQAPQSEYDYYFVAVRSEDQDDAVVRCESVVGCQKNTLVAASASCHSRIVA